jgi:tripartite-type tricarboxylate transporter receptor subunit TctC
MRDRYVPSLPAVKLLLLVLSILLVTNLGCRRERVYPRRPILLVCPWAQGGGTDRVSRTVAAHLESELGVPVNVVNATGGKGVTGHSRGLAARPDGYTLTMATLELNTMHWSGLTDLTVADCIPLMSLNEDYAALFVRQDAPWQNLAELEAAIRQQPTPGSMTASGTTTGGAWHLAVAGWLDATGLGVESVTWVSSTGSAPSLQELISGGFDMVCCALSEAESLLQAGEVRALGVMSPTRALGYESVPTFKEQGTDWSLGGWRAVVVPQETPPEICDKLQAALNRMADGETTVAGTTFPQFMEQSGFDHTIRTGDALRQFLTDTDAKFGQLLTSDAMRSVNQDPYPAMAFPWMLLGLMSCTLVGIALAGLRSGEGFGWQADRLQNADYGSFLLVIASIVGYVLVAETVGFVLTSALILLILMIRMGASARVTAIMVLVFPAVIYHLFTHVLRVPLPQGWLGW